MPRCMRKVLVAVVLLGLAVWTPAGAADPPVLRIQDFRYVPSPLTVSRGTRVAVVNLDGAMLIPHSVTSCVMNSTKMACATTNATSSGAFTTGEFLLAGSFVAPTIVGPYWYYCTVHELVGPKMRGKLVVVV